LYSASKVSHRSKSISGSASSLSSPVFISVSIRVQPRLIPHWFSFVRLWLARPHSPPDPGFTLRLLSIGGLGIGLQHPLARWVLAEAGLESLQSVAPGDQERHLLAGLETLHPPGPPLGMNPIIADGQDFVADVETRLESGRAAFDLVDHQAALLILGQQAQPRLGRLVRVLVLLIVLGEGEAEAQPVEGLGVI